MIELGLVPIRYQTCISGQSNVAVFVHPQSWQMRGSPMKAGIDWFGRSTSLDA
jgi:hypothetical protein